jgi:molybdate transport system permease protein
VETESQVSTASVATSNELPREIAAGSDTPFVVSLFIFGGTYVFLIVAMLAADIFFTTPDEPDVRMHIHMLNALATPEIQYAIRLSLITCTIATILSVWVAVPLGYLLSRYKFPFKNVIDAIIDIPIVLPPLVVGLSLLILFRTAPGRAVESVLPFTYAVPGIVLAQFAVSCAFAVRTMRTTFDEISPRQEQVALTLGCSRSDAFWYVVLPDARRGVITAATLAWARSLGEFGPILIFAGATPMQTEVLSTTVFLELSIGRIHAAVAVSLVMIAAAAAVLITLRIFGLPSWGRT